MKDRQKYNTETGIYYKSGFIDVVNNCNGYMFTNTGDTIAELNGMVIYPGDLTPGSEALGDSRSVGGNEGELFVGTLRLIFRTPLGANPRVEIVQKFYID